MSALVIVQVKGGRDFLIKLMPFSILFFIAIHFDPKNVQLLWERASLYTEMQDTKRAIDSFELLLKVGV